MKKNALPCPQNCEQNRAPVRSILKILNMIVSRVFGNAGASLAGLAKLADRAGKRKVARGKNRAPVRSILNPCGAVGSAYT